MSGVGNAGWEVGNGAGGINDSKVGYMTFYSANVPVEIFPEEAPAIPGLQFLAQKIAKMPLPTSCTALMYLNTYPSPKRRYFRAKDGEEFDKAKKKLIRQYSAITHIPSEHLVLFAITDPATSTTLLLPEFYHLSEVEQAAILFHESLWAGGYGLSYETVIMAEQAAQAYFLNSNDKETYYRFFATLNNVLPAHLGRYALLYAAINFELNNKKMPFLEMVGPGIGNTTASFYDYRGALTVQVMNKLNENPQSMFWRAMLDYVSKSQSTIIINFSDYRGQSVLAPTTSVLFVPNLDNGLFVLPLLDSSGSQVGTITL